MGKGEKVNGTLVFRDKTEDYKCALSQSMHFECSKFVGRHVASLDQLESAYMCSASHIVDS